MRSQLNYIEVFFAVVVVVDSFVAVFFWLFILGLVIVNKSLIGTS